MTSRQNEPIATIRRADCVVCSRDYVTPAPANTPVRRVILKDTKFSGLPEGDDGIREGVVCEEHLDVIREEVKRDIVQALGGTKMYVEDDP